MSPGRQDLVRAELPRQVTAALPWVRLVDDKSLSGVRSTSMPARPRRLSATSPVIRSCRRAKIAKPATSTSPSLASPGLYYKPRDSPVLNHERPSSAGGGTSEICQTQTILLSDVISNVAPTSDIASRAPRRSNGAISGCFAFLQLERLRQRVLS